MRTKGQSLILRYGVSFLAVGLCLLLKLSLPRLIQEGSPFLLLFAAVMVSSWYGGLGPGLLATGLAALASDLLFINPTHLFLANNLNENLRLGMFLLEAVLISLMSASRKQAEQRLREQAALLDLAQDAIIVQDLKDRILFWNKSAERIYGPTTSDAKGSDIRTLLGNGNPSRLGEAKQAALKKGEWFGELRQTTKEGKEIIVESRWVLVRDDKGNPKSLLLINSDVTEKRKLEAQFLRTQRMESIGTLAGGIAHNLGNMLSPILMSICVLRRMFRDKESQQLLGIIEANAERGGAMVKQVLSFARGAEGERVPIQLRHLIKEIVKILQGTLPKSIDIDSHVPKDLWYVTGDATQIHQVLMNLCVNARDAMPMGGKLMIEAENVALDQNNDCDNLEAGPQRSVIIKVTDTGTGIRPDLLDKIFEPFFTTKEQGKGSGLGLSTVMGIVKTHGGHISVSSQVGQGTEFKIHLPAVEGAESKQDEGCDRGSLEGRGELILVVDDEPGFQEVTRKTLEVFGYSVLAASEGAEAIQLYVQNKERIKVVLIDMVMPYIDGAATIRALQRLDPQIRIIATSGLAEESNSTEVTKTVAAFLPKPYTGEKLAMILAEILSEAEA